MKHARPLLQTLIPLVLVLSLVLPLWVGQASLASEALSACSVTRSHTTSASERYNVPATCFADAGWALPIPASADGNLETSTNYDYDSPIYLSNHGFRHGGVDWVGPLDSPYDTSTPVRAIGDGTIRHVVRDDDPTTNNSRLHIEHTAANGTKFLAIYGHTYAPSSFSVGGTVYYGQQIGTLRQYGSPIHLHFELNTILTTTSYGGVKDGTVNPLQFLIDNPGSGSTIDLALVSCYSQKFPFIYLTVRASSNGQPVSDLTKADFSVTEDGRLQTDMFDVVPPQEGGGVRMADIVFLIDNSGSMGYEINSVKNNCEAFAEALVASDIDYRLGLVQFGQSANGGNPRIIGDGLTGSVSEFKSWVATMPADGYYEPGFAAIRLAIQSYNFRPASQKVFVLITDEDSDCRDKQTTIDMILANDVTVHVAADCSFGTSQSDYCGTGSVRDVSGGLLFPVMGDYRSILDTIGEAVANTYIVRYRTDNPALDGTVRTVVCTVQKGTASDFVQCTYVAGGAPHIQRTEETLALHNQSLVAGSSPTISVLVTDAAEPFVQSVTLFVRTAGSGKAYGQIAMLPQGNDIYAADVPGSYVQSPGLDYYIRATDGQATSWDPSTDPDKKPYQIAVLPNESPVIEHTPPTSWQTGNDVSLGISAYDSTYGIASLNVYYRKQGDLLWQAIVSEYDPPPYAMGKTVVLPVAGWNTAAIEYYIQVIDDLGVSSHWPLGGADAPFLLRSGATGILLIPSEEDTWPTKYGQWWESVKRHAEVSHILALNIEEPINHYGKFNERIEGIVSQGGIAILAHPLPLLTPSYIIESRGYVAIEVYNAVMAKNAAKPGLAWLSGWFDSTWDYILQERVPSGDIVWGIASDDAHEKEDYGKTWIMVRAPALSKTAILAGIKDGNFYAVRGPSEDPKVIRDITVTADKRTIMISTSRPMGAVVSTGKERGEREVYLPVSTIHTYTVEGNERWVRFHFLVAEDLDGCRVWTQPFVVGPHGVTMNPYEETTGDWYKGQLHCHTTGSDAQWKAGDDWIPTPDNVVQLYTEKGYDFLAITDHNRITVPGHLRMTTQLELAVGRVFQKASVKVVDWAGVPVNNIEVTGRWEWDGKTQQVGPKSTDDDGVVEFQLTHIVLPGQTRTFRFVLDEVARPAWQWVDGDRSVSVIISVPLPWRRP